MLGKACSGLAICYKLVLVELVCCREESLSEVIVPKSSPGLVCHLFNK